MYFIGGKGASCVMIPKVSMKLMEAFCFSEKVLRFVSGGVFRKCGFLSGASVVLLVYIMVLTYGSVRVNGWNNESSDGKLYEKK